MGDQWMPASTVPNLVPAQSLPAESAQPGSTPNGRLMEMALASLSGQWAVSIGAAVLYQVVVGAANFTPYLNVLIMLLISGPMLLGLNRFFLNLARRRSPDVGQLFDGFKLFGKSIAAYLLVTLFICLWSLLALIPGIFAAIVIPAINKTPEMAILLAPLLVALFILAMIPAIRAGLAYSQTFYVLSDHPDVGAMEAIRRSQRMMDGNKWKFFCLGFRFVGWYLLSILTCLIGLLWVVPYQMATFAHFYDDVRNS